MSVAIDQSTDRTREAAQHIVLCVDDEPNIVAALRRVFRPHGYQIITALSGADGLAILAQQHVDVVISDMRMPGMDGAAFLEQVRKSWPDVIRLLLTGHSDIEATIGAINRGEIHRYISKPWDDDDLVLILQQACERREIEQENRRLEALTQQQNRTLQELNNSLEIRVAERTEQVASACNALSAANAKLKSSFLTSIKILSSLIELREIDHVGHSRRVAELARRLALQMDLGAADINDIFLAALLHDVGKIGLADAILRDPSSRKALEASPIYRQYPLRSQQVVSPLSELRGAAALIRSHRERFDGRGFPDGLTGEEIPLGARILSLAKDYDALQIGMYSRQRLSAAAARAEIVSNQAALYGEDVVAAFVRLVDGTALPVARDLRIKPNDIGPGMVLSRDLTTPEGFLLLAADHVLDPVVVARIREYEASHPRSLVIYVHAAASAEADQQSEVEAS